MPKVTLRPTSDGSLLENSISPVAPPTHYDKVDEDPPNDATDYIYSGDAAGVYRDSFLKQALDVPAASTIDSLIIYNRILTDIGEARYRGRVATLLRDFVGTLAIGTDTIADAWTTISTTYVTSPFTGLPWTISEVVFLQIGSRTRTNTDPVSGPVRGYCSTVWLDVFFTPPVARPLINKPLVNPILVNIPIVRII